MGKSKKGGRSLFTLGLVWFGWFIDPDCGYFDCISKNATYEASLF